MHNCVANSCIFLLFFGCWGCSHHPSPAFSPEESLKRFQLPPGLRIELVASEPMVQDPAVIHFDEDGRLWVVEMRGFMPNIEGDGEEAPVGRVSVLSDTNGDGKMDNSVIFLDSLVLPRALAFVEGGILVAEKIPLWLVKDLDGDLKADQKILIDSSYGGRGMPEHSPNGLWRGMDNWYYNAKSAFRYRLREGHWVKEKTEFRGQWGISHDDIGRLYYNYNWSQLHADLVPPNYFSRNKHHTITTGIDHGLTIDRRIFPARPNPAVNRGYIPGALDETGRLLEFTSACSPFVFRGTALPEAFRGDAFVCEPAGNLIKRNIVAEDGLMLLATNAYPDKEFLASTDERFRPVFLTTGPDGALYVADMYRGIIEHGPYMTPYLREQTVLRQLEQPIHMGRIWRIVKDNWQAPDIHALSTVSSAFLVDLLSHPNGWTRDAAQRLLVQKKARASIPMLENLVLNGPEKLGKLHALWTLEGLGSTNSSLLFEAMEDADPTVQATALRLLETLARNNSKVQSHLESVLPKVLNEAKAPFLLQIALTAEVLSVPNTIQLLEEILEKEGGSSLIRDAVISSLQDREFDLLQRLWKSPQWKNHQPYKEIFFEQLTTAVANSGNLYSLKQILSMVDVAPSSFSWREKALLSGMLIHTGKKDSLRIDLNAVPMLVALKEQYNADIQHRIGSLGTLFKWPGQQGKTTDRTLVVPLDEAQQKQFAIGRQHYLSICASCHGTDGTGLRRFAPPLTGSEWVLGDEKRLALILLHGMEGPVLVNGKNYDAPEILPVMPALSVMSDAAIAAVMTYIRREWGHSAPPVKASTVGHIRHRSQGKVSPWSAAELMAVKGEEEKKQ